MSVCLCVCVCVYMCVCECIHVCECIYIFKLTRNKTSSNIPANIVLIVPSTSSRFDRFEKNGTAKFKRK